MYLFDARQTPRLSAKAWILLLMLAASLPLVSLAVYTITELGRSQQDSLTTSLEQRGEATANAIAQQVNTVSAALLGLSVVDPINRGDVAALYRDAKTLASRIRGATAITLVQEDGQMVFNTLMPFGASLAPSTSVASVQKAINKDLPTISAPFIGPVTKKSVVAVTVPVQIAGKAYGLRMILRTDLFVDTIREQRLPAEWFAVVADETGTIIARSHEPDKYVGKKVSPSLLQSLAAGRRGTFESVTLEGTPVKTMFTKVPAWDLVVAVAVPTSVLNRPLTDSLSKVGIGTAVVLALGIILALWISRQLAMANMPGAAENLQPIGGVAPTNGADVSFASEAARKLDRQTPGTIVLGLPPVRYAIALALYGAALALRIAILPTGEGLGFLTFYPATAFAALWCGTGPGLMVMVLGGITAHYGFMPPFWSWKWPIPALQIISEVPYLVSGIVVCLIVDRMRRYAEAGRKIAAQLTQEVSERKRVAADLALSMEKLERSNRELDEFAYIASHDLKEPLRGIHNYATYLQDDYADKLDADGRSYLERMQRLVERQTALMERLLAYSRIGHADMPVTIIDLNDLLDDTTEDLAAFLRDAKVELRRPGRLPKVRCNEAWIGEVFQNLIVNAGKYNDKPEKWVEVGCDETVKPPVFYVRDNGIGIAPQHLESVFRIFKRLHEQNKFGGGTGAGLTIVKKIIERHGGRIWLESAPGTGTTFYFTMMGESA